VLKKNIFMRKFRTTRFVDSLTSHGRVLLVTAVLEFSRRGFHECFRNSCLYERKNS